MRVINTIDKITSCFPNGKFELSAWQDYIQSFSLPLVEKCRQDAAAYDFEKEILPVLNNAIVSKDELSMLNNAFLLTVNKLEDNIGRLFDEEPEIDLILYLGLCNGAGWETMLDHRDTVLLGIEKIIELGWQDEINMQALVCHEIGHIWHKMYGKPYPEVFRTGDKSLMQLYREGIAMRCEQFLCQDDNFYHQDKDGWLAWCQANASNMKQEYVRRIQGNESTQDFFGDWCNYQGRSDVGYYLGCEFIKFLEQDESLKQIANLDIAALREAFMMFCAR